MTVLDLYNWLIQNSSVAFLFSILGLAVLFLLSAKKSSKEFQDILDRTDLRIIVWQEKIMASTVKTWDSTPQVIESRITLAKIDTAEQLTRSIHEIVSNAQGGASGYTQQQTLIVLTAKLQSLLVSMSEKYE